MEQCTLSTPMGALTLRVHQGIIVFAGLEDRPLSAPTTPLLRRAAGEVEEYFAGERQSFSVPAAPEGTAFQCAVWHAAMAIPYGQTRTYGQLAAAMGSPGAARAVGGALHRNPVLLWIPCHRIVGADGSLTGFGCGVEKKALLLALERRYFRP